MPIHALALQLDDASVPSVDTAWHEPVEDPVGPAVLLTHGAGGDLDDHVLVEAATVLADGGHLVVRANLGYRQRRPSGPPPRPATSVGDLRAILRAVADRRGGRSWVVGGKSYGGRMATLLAAEHADVVGVLCLSYPLHPPGRPDRLRVDHFPDVAVPVLVVQGGSDPFGSADELAAHTPDLGAAATVLEVPHAGHGLHVARTRSVDGATHRSADVLAHRGPAILDWLRDLA